MKKETEKGLGMIWFHESKISSLPMNFKWHINDYKKFSNLLLTNDQLFSVVSKVGHKAAIGLAAALTEIIWWRLNEFPGIEKFQPKNEALWACTIDPNYLKNYDFDYKILTDEGIPTPLAANWYILRFMMQKYTEGSFYLHQYLVNLVMLTRHLMPNKKLFDDWFTETIRRTTETFPCPYDYEELNMDDANARYDCLDEAPVPREFFFHPEFEYSRGNASSSLNTFLKTLDYKTNPYLCSTQEMIEKGFKGTPYTI